MREQITRFPKPPVELFADVRNKFGSCTDRRLWRALARLLADGEIDRVGIPRHPDGYRLREQARRTE